MKGTRGNVTEQLDCYLAQLEDTLLDRGVPLPVAYEAVRIAAQQALNPQGPRDVQVAA